LPAAAFGAAPRTDTGGAPLRATALPDDFGRAAAPAFRPVSAVRARAGFAARRADFMRFFAGLRLERRTPAGFDFARLPALVLRGVAMSNPSYR